jgi:hypothetical protein
VYPHKPRCLSHHARSKGHQSVLAIHLGYRETGYTFSCLTKKLVPTIKLDLKARGTRCIQHFARCAKKGPCGPCKNRNMRFSFPRLSIRSIYPITRPLINLSDNLGKI